MHLATLSLILLIVLLLGALPAWSQTQNLGYLPGSSIGLVLIALLVVVLVGRV